MHEIVEQIFGIKTDLHLQLWFCEISVLLNDAFRTIEEF